MNELGMEEGWLDRGAHGQQQFVCIDRCFVAADQKHHIRQKWAQTQRTPIILQRGKGQWSCCWRLGLRFGAGLFAAAFVARRRQRLLVTVHAVQEHGLGFLRASYETRNQEGSGQVL
jgi:hypothetical protein